MTIPAIDLNLIVVLHTVLTERNVARAAARLHVTPSAVSNALARLREVLGDPIVTRKGRGIVPTPRAEEIAPSIARAMQEIERALLTSPFDASSCTRTFSLAVADLGQIVWGPGLADAMEREMPRARLRVVGIDALVSLGDLGSSEIDLHIGVAPKAPGLHVEPLFEEKSVLVARAGHPQVSGRSARRISRRALSVLRHVRVDLTPAKNLRDRFTALFAKAGIAREVVMTVPSFTTAAEIVARTDLVTMLPSSLLATKGQALRLLPVPGPVPALAVPLAMCWHDRTHADAAARAFRALVRRVVMDGL